MGIFEEVSSTVGKLALTPKGWRLAALISITVLCAAAYGMQKLVIVVLEADRQTFIDRDASNARAVVVVDRKVDEKFAATNAKAEVIVERVDSLEKQFIETHTDVRWIRQTMQRWDTPPPSPPPK